jgi:hypothetical protein
MDDIRDVQLKGYFWKLYEELLERKVAAPV